MNVLTAMITPAVLISGAGTLIMSTSTRVGRATDREARANEVVAELQARGDTEKADAMKSQVLFTVRQRRQDLATEIAVATQGYMSLGLVLQNNDQLITAVDRAKSTTVAALYTAVIVSEAAPGCAPHRIRFLARNRLIAALAGVVPFFVYTTVFLIIPTLVSILWMTTFGGTAMNQFLVDGYTGAVRYNQLHGYPG